MNILARLKNGHLSARERSFFSALLGAFIGLMANLLPQLPTILTGGHISITPIVASMLIAAFILAFIRLWVGQQDPRVAEILQAYSSQLEQAAETMATTPEGHVPVIHITAPVSTPTAKITLAPIAPPTTADMPTIQMNTTASAQPLPTTISRQFALTHDPSAPTQVDIPIVNP